MPRRHISITAIALWISVSFGWPAWTLAQSAGPAFWAVTGIPAGTGLNVRAQPSMTGDPVGTLPHDAQGVANLGCRGGSNPAAEDAEGREAARNRWCRVRYKGVEGWVAARFLKADPGPPPVEPKAPAAADPPAAAPKPSVEPNPQATAPPPPIDPGSQTAVPKAPVAPGAGAPLSFACVATEAIVVMVDRDGAVTHQRFPPRETIRLMLTVTPSAPESAGPVAPASIWQLAGQQGERFAGTITWGKAIDAQDGHWQLDLQSRTLSLVRPREATSAQFYRFRCE